MRALIVFLLALGLGSLAVIGQDNDDDGDRELKRRIVYLDSMLRELAARRGRANRNPVVEQRIYEVSDLVAPVRDSSMHPSNLIPSKFQPPGVEELEPRSAYDVDWIIDLIRTTVDPDSWDTIEGADIMPKRGGLLVNTVPQVHERIAARLNEFRAFIAPHVVVDVVAVRVDPEQAALLARFPRDLGKDAANRLMAGEWLGNLSAVCVDGQQVVRREGTLRAYLQDWDVEIAQKSSIGDPIRRAVFDGCTIEMRAILDRDRGGASLHYRLERTEFGDTIRRVPTEHGPLELPTMDVTRLNASCWVPLDRTVVLGGVTSGDSCVFLATARRVELRR